MDDSIHSFNSEKYCFLSMFPEVVYWKLVTSNKMNFVHVRKNAHFFMLTGFFKNLFYVIYTEKKITRKVSEGTFREYILPRVRKSQ